MPDSIWLLVPGTFPCLSLDKSTGFCPPLDIETLISLQQISVYKVKNTMYQGQPFIRKIGWEWKRFKNNKDEIQWRDWKMKKQVVNVNNSKEE